jgi:inner membrane transporter RhtA
LLPGSTWGAGDRVFRHYAVYILPRVIPQRVSPLAAVLLLLVAIASIQCGASLAKSLFPALGAAGTSALRLAFATGILAAIWRPWRLRRENLSAKGLRAIVAYGLSLGAMNLSYYLALERLALGLTVALEFTGPLAVALLGSRRLLDVAWAILAGAGIVLILPLTSAASAGVDPVGAVLALIAGACWALYIVLGQHAGAHAHSGTVTSIGMLVAAALVLPFGIWDAGTKLLEPRLLPLGFGVAVLSSALPYSLEMIALKNLPARNFGILLSLSPAMAALSGLVLLDERLSTLQWIAIGCIVAASLGSSVLSFPQRAPTE